MVGRPYTAWDVLDTPWLIRGERVCHKRRCLPANSCGRRPYKTRDCTVILAPFNALILEI